MPTRRVAIMRLEVSAPEHCLGDVISDLNARRGRIEAIADRPPACVVDALVPLPGLLDYQEALQSISLGRAHFRSSFSHYETIEDDPDASGGQAGVPSPLPPPGPTRSAVRPPQTRSSRPPG